MMMDIRTFCYALVVAGVGFVLGWLFGFAESASMVSAASYSW